jgi:hypothetical protein
MVRLSRSLVPAVSLVILVSPAPAAEVRVANRAELVAALASAAPGTQILVEPGTYQGGVSLTGLRGTAEEPIVIAAADPERRPVIQGGGSGLQLSSPEHVELRGLEFAGATGNGLNIDDGGSIDAPARHVVVRDVYVHDVGPEGNSDGVKLSGVDDFLLVGCRIERWGSGGSGVDMVGCHRGVIEQCRLLGRGGEQASGVQTKGGSSEIVVRRSRIEEPGGRGVNIGGSTGLPFFRPRDAAYEARAITVEDCEFVGGAAAVAFVGVDGAVVRHNTIYRPRIWAVRILQETAGERFVPCRNGQFTRNLVVFRADEIRSVFNVGGNTAPDTFQFAGNAWAAIDRPDDTRRLVNLPVKERNGAYGPPPEFIDAENGDVRLRTREPKDPGARTAAE